MSRFYILTDIYLPNSAATNHLLSFVRGFSELGISLQLVFLLPDGRFSRLEKNFPNIDIRYLWSDTYSNNKVLRHIYKHFQYAKFFYSLKKGDTVLVLGMSAYIPRLTKRKGVKIFHERTEHPDVVRSTRYQFQKNAYLKSLKNCDGLFVISNPLKEYFETSCGVDRNRIIIINMVVDSARFTGVKKNNDVEPYIAYCGNASNTKDGVDVLIKAFKVFHDNVDNVKLYIIGNSPQKESNNSQLVKELNLESHIVFTGIIPSEDMPQLLKNAMMLALARPQSLQNTCGFPTKLGEYLLTGNPVVITKVGDIPLFLKDKESALMSECGDIKAFADNLLWVYNHPEEANLIGENGKRIALESFNYKKETLKMTNIMFE